MPRIVVMRALRRFRGAAEGSVRPGRAFRTSEARATRLEQATPPFAERLVAADWPLKLKPEDYLRQQPNGKHAHLARKLTGGA